MSKEIISAISNMPVFKGLTLIGGHPALDLLNTVKYRGAADPEDKLESISDVLVWGRTVGLISAQEFIDIESLVGRSVSDARLLNKIHAFREQLRILFSESGRQSDEFDAAISSVEHAVSKLRYSATIDIKTGVLSQTTELSQLVDIFSRIVSNVAELLSQRESLKIKSCGGTDCDWLFIDRTKAKRRQWCDTRTCGNLARVRKYRSRRNS